MKKIYTIFNIAFLLILCSCSSDKAVEFGTVSYYPKFLWVDEKLIPVEKTFDLDFSQDAKNDKNCFAEFQFVDNDDKPISTDVMRTYVSGIKLKDNMLRVTSDLHSQKVTFEFTPQAEGGEYQGYLRLVNHNLDRLDSEELKKGQKMNVLQWTIGYDKQINPLAKGLLWLLIIICACLLVWFCMLKPLVYPCFGKFKKTIMIEQDGKIVGQLSTNFKDARRVVFADKIVKQSFKSRLFTGKIKTVVNPLFSEKLTFLPKKKNAIIYGNGYIANPYIIPRNGMAAIVNHQKKLKITLR